MVLKDTNRSLPKPLNKGNSKCLVYDKDKGKENRAPEEDQLLRTDSQVRKRKLTSTPHTHHKKTKYDKIPINIPVDTCSKEAEQEESIELISKRLKQNMTRATYNALASLLQSNRPQDLFVYEKVFCDRQHLMPTETPELSVRVDTPPMEKKQEFLRFDSSHFTKNLSFNSDQENDFINTWIQCHNEGKEPRALLNQDSFSIVTEELSGKATFFVSLVLLLFVIV
ncbi:hypothetical protein BY458DRAFT_511996 [Sporodiniella umbellata]|nr:hypothetical protein BY458DRAFT_511996 [Sporodiniella umbellata]